MENKPIDKEEFDVHVMCESFEKAKKVTEKLKLKMTPELFQNLAVTFFINSMSNIRESRKSKKLEGYY